MPVSAYESTNVELLRNLLSMRMNGAPNKQDDEQDIQEQQQQDGTAVPQATLDSVKYWLENQVVSFEDKKDGLNVYKVPIVALDLTFDETKRQSTPSRSTGTPVRSVSQNKQISPKRPQPATPKTTTKQPMSPASPMTADELGVSRRDKLKTFFVELKLPNKVTNAYYYHDDQTLQLMLREDDDLLVQACSIARDAGLPSSVVPTIEAALVVSACIFVINNKENLEAAKRDNDDLTRYDGNNISVCYSF